MIVKTDDVVVDLVYYVVGRFPDNICILKCDKYEPHNKTNNNNYVIDSCDGYSLESCAINLMHSPRGSIQGVSNAGNALDPIYVTLTGLTGSQHGVLGTSSAITNEGLATSVSVQDVTFSSNPTRGDISSDLRRPAVDSAGVFTGGDGKGGRISKMQYNWEVTTIDEPSNVIYFMGLGALALIHAPP
jgi:hypothetical protein